MSRYWISWHQPTEDFRPIHYPPHKSVIGWWCSGTSEQDAIICAVVDAPDEIAAKSAVLHEWPEAERWRFCDLRDSDWRPSDRFPLSDWMAELLGAEAAT